MKAAPPAPEEVRAAFNRLRSHDPEQAVRYLYDLGIESGYIRLEDIARNVRWTGDSSYGTLECTINLAKPEKDPRAIAKAAAGKRLASGLRESPRSAIASSASRAPGAPLCDLCWENEGFPGSPEHPAKPGLRIAAIELGGERWGLQYSPYAYFDEHCIALSERHRPMKIDAACFERLLDFVDAFPFYFVGSNADLPIVGGSILSHDHFQGGRHMFPLMKAPIERDVPLAGTPRVNCGIVRWPASVLRLVSDERSALSHAATQVLAAWQSHDDERCGIVAHDADGPHNALNPIVHRDGSAYVMDLVLRNNRTDEDHPWGIFHPGEELHHLKKENIGLIEIMGLAILPPRLARELPAVQRALTQAARTDRSLRDVEALLRAQDECTPHADWAADMYDRRVAELALEDASNETIGRVLREEVARAFAAILETTGVFKRDAVGQAGWDRFADALRKTQS